MYLLHFSLWLILVSSDSLLGTSEDQRREFHRDDHPDFQCKKIRLLSEEDSDVNVPLVPLAH
jgi:hypothetical protein